MNCYQRMRWTLAGGPGLLALITLGMSPAQETAGGKPGLEVGKGRWIAISDGVLKAIAAEGKKPGWPGGTAGVSVDRKTGEVRVIVPDQGLWNSSDRGTTFRRVDGGSLGGR